MLSQSKGRFARRAATGASAWALATALAAGPAQGQTSLAYNAGDPTVVSGNVTFTRGQTPGVEVYNVNSPTAVLDFTPADTTGTGNINFQNAGSTVTYQGASDFTVLNRIVPADPTRAIQFNGTVNSQISAGTGGSVWFYSPGGVVLGNGAIFNVGSLLLATGDPTGGSGTITSTNVFNLSSKADSGYAVTIQPGAKINALNEGSYVALVAPVVNQNGEVRVNGNAAYVAAEQATLTFSGGLFDIQVTTGSDGGGTPLTHNGSTAGPSSTGGGDKHGIYMVAVPKNSAITMAIAPTGQLGFDVAASATIENGAIYLQAGGSVTIDPTQTIVNRIKNLPNSVNPASIQINSADITSTLAVQATTDSALFAGNPGLTLAQETYVFAGRNATLVAGTGAVFTADKGVTVDAIGQGAASKAQIDALAGSTMSFESIRLNAGSAGRVINVAEGGTAALRSTNGTITVSGDATVTAEVFTNDPVATVGGKADITVNQGSITIGGSAEVFTIAQSTGPTSNATGGTANVSAFGGGSIKTGLLNVSSEAITEGGGTARGGTALLSTGTDGGSIEAGSANVVAGAESNFALNGPAGQAIGGKALIDIAPIASTGTGSITLASANVNARAIGGDASGTLTVTQNGDAATGGLARVQVNKGGSLVSTGSIELRSVARGGEGVNGGDGGSATQGESRMSAFDGGSISFATTKLDASTFGGVGGAASSSAEPTGTGGTAIKGPGAFVFAGGGGTITGGNTQVLAMARSGQGGGGFTGGFAGAGGAAEAGSAVISTDTGGKITLGDTSILAGATAANTGAGTANGTLAGGNATGGVATLNAKAGTIDLASVVLATDAIGGNGVAAGASGGDARGGVAFAGANGGGTLRLATDLLVDVVATGGSSINTIGGRGGDAIAGTADVVSRGTIELIEGDLAIDASAFGGFASTSTGGQGGDARGGTASAAAQGGAFRIAGRATLAADASGGAASAAQNGAGGAGIGGLARLGTFSSAGPSVMTVGDSVDLDASGFGGDGGSGSRGGDGSGGTPTEPTLADRGAYLVATGGTVTVTSYSDILAAGAGGDGGLAGGKGTGGIAEIFAIGASISVGGESYLDASGRGGNASFGSSLAGRGGDGIGGATFVTSDSGGRFGVPAGTPSVIMLNLLVHESTGRGGDGGEGAATGTAGRGGDGIGGSAAAIAEAGSGRLQVERLFASVQGEGGQGGFSNEGTGGTGGLGRGGFAGSFGTASGTDTAGNDGRAVIKDLFVSAIGRGGEGGDSEVGPGGGGGEAIGGTAGILARGAPATFTTVSLNAGATAGSGGFGGVGMSDGEAGAASGGTIQLTATNRFERPERGALAIGTFFGSATIFAGEGEPGVGTGGSFRLLVSQADVTADAITISEFDTGTPGAASSIRIDNGTLAVATGLDVFLPGDLELAIGDGGLLDATSVSITSGGSLLSPAIATPGTIQAGEGFFADFAGDFVTTADFQLDGSLNVTAGGKLQVGNVTADQVTLSTLNFNPVTGANTGGAIQAGNIVASDSVFLNSGSDLTAGNISAGDSVETYANGFLKLGNVTAALGEAVAGQEGFFGFISLEGDAAISVGNVTGVSIDIYSDRSDGDLEIPRSGPTQTGSLKAEAINVESEGSVTTGDLIVGDFYAIDLSTEFDAPFELGVAGFGDVKVGAVTAAGSFAIGSETGSVSTGAISAQDSVLILAKNDVTVAGGIDAGAAADGNVLISNVSIIETDPLFAEFDGVDHLDFSLSDALSTLVPVRLDGAIAIGGPVATTNFAAAAQGSFKADGIAAPERLLLDIGGTITGAAFSTGGALQLFSDRSIVLGDLTATTVDLRSKVDVTTGAINASGAVRIDAQGVAFFTGLVGGASIDVTSAGIVLTGSGALGTPATSRLSLRATANTVRFGGGDADGGYSLSAAEARRLRAERIEFRSGNATIGELTLQGANAGEGTNLIGPSGRLLIDVGSESSLRVVGQVTINDAASGNEVALRAGSIDVVTDLGGGIALFGNAPTSLGGRLVLAAPDVRVATGAVIDQLRASPESAGRAQALATPPAGPARPAGYLQANRMEFQTSRRLFIQNSNSASEFGGFSAGTGGVTVRDDSSSSPLDAVIFGRIQDSAGSFKINQDAVGLLVIASGEGGATTVTPASTFNSCPFSGCTIVEPPPPEENPLQELLIDRIPAVIQAALSSAISSVSEPETIAALPTINLVTTIDTAPIRTEPVISDPVTGGGNPGLWDSADDTDESEERRPAPGRGGGQ